MIEKINFCDRNSIFFSSFLFFVSVAFFAGVSLAQTPEQIKYYSERIEFGTEDVKRNALFDLRNFQTESASRVALPALKDSSEIIRATATHTVIYLPKNESAQALLPLLNEQSEFIRKETVLALGKTHNPDVSEALLILLKKDKKPEVRVAVAISLGLAGNQIAVEPLLDILKKKPKKSENFLRRSAARSIGQIAEAIQNKNVSFETPEDFLPSKFKNTQNLQYEDLTNQNTVFRSAIPILIKSLQNKKEFPDVKRESAFALGAIGAQNAISVLRSNSNNEDYYLAEICKEALLKINKN
jgi:HEAT repeat protein